MTDKNIEDVMIFAASCVESVAQSLGLSAKEVYEMMKRVNLIDGYIIKCYDTLHTESRDNVTKDIIETLRVWEAAEE